MYTLATEYGLFAFEVFAEEAVAEVVGLLLEEVEVIHAVLFRANLGFVLCEGERVGWNVDFGDNLHATAVGQGL